MTCARCIHFTDKALSDASSEPNKDPISKVGICRRHPPRMTARGDRFLASVFPHVHPRHECGEFDAGAMVI